MPSTGLIIAASVLTAVMALSSQRPGAAAASRAHADALFTKVWTVADGVGPLANAQSCAACHAVPFVGGTSVDREAFVLLSAEETDETGGHLFRQLLLRPGRAVVRRALPRAVITRRPPPLFGIGILEKVSDAALNSAADPDDRNGDGISGRRGAGRFGWKARFPAVRDAVAAALVGELGLTSRVFPGRASAPHEIEDGDLDALTAFVAALAPLPPRKLPAGGVEVFDRAGCGGCHRSRGQPSVEPYTDLLLHDMGRLGDGLAEAGAAAREVRTAPLWGLGRTGPPYLHDGRADSIDEAIRAHDGEAAATRARYLKLSSEDRRRLLTFLAQL